MLGRFSLLIALVVLLPGCVSPSTARRREASSQPVPSYTRVATPNTNIVALQIALRKFTPRSGRGPAVWLSGVSHIGESNYYAGLQRHLDAQSLVLFEGVGARDRTLRFDPAEQSSIQHTLATSLGLVFQLTAIEYDRPHFRNSDLTVPELQRMLAGEHTPAGNAPESAEKKSDDEDGGGREESPEFRELMGVMNGSSMLGMLVHLGVRFLGSSPKLQAMTKLAMIETLGSFQGDLAEVKSVPPELQRLMTVIVRGRNDVVMRDLRKHLRTARVGQSFSVFYGAGHMADLERRLVDELGYRRREELWLTALSVDVQAAGLTPAELQMVRGLVQWQLNALKSQ